MASFPGRVGGSRMSLPASRLLRCESTSMLARGDLNCRLLLYPFASNRPALIGIARPGTYFYGGVRAYYRPAD